MLSSAIWPILIHFKGKRYVKKMNGVFIPSHGIGEVYIDVFDMRWQMLSSSFYNFRKNIPFFKLLLDMGRLMMRCYIRLDARETDAYNVILLNDFKEKAIYLMKSYKKIESLSEDLFATNDIEAYNHCMKVFDQYVRNEKKKNSLIITKKLTLHLLI